MLLKRKVEEKQKETREQIKELKNIYKYTVVAVNDKIYVEEIK